ncbi:MAG: helix-turn-helix domain-containing protein [Candidatus Obscuribacter sp.]|nr:helix-turn-helix domain-containing protein [Candidatus Obscuribacter sp.]MBK9276576.1 helix-turn-helix domain-containing protein [Candidatus Obscuribacter sp.]
MIEGDKRGRWTVKAKTDLVLRLLKGETAAELSELFGISEVEIERWCEEFKTNGSEGLRAKPRTGENRRLTEANRVVEHLKTEIAILRAALSIDNRSFQ